MRTVDSFHFRFWYFQQTTSQIRSHWINETWIKVAKVMPGFDVNDFPRLSFGILPASSTPARWLIWMINQIRHRDGGSENARFLSFARDHFTEG